MDRAALFQYQLSRRLPDKARVILCAYTVLGHGDSAVSRTQKVPVLMELTIWWKKTDKSQENKQDNFR